MHELCHLIEIIAYCNYIESFSMVLKDGWGVYQYRNTNVHNCFTSRWLFEVSVWRAFFMFFLVHNLWSPI